MKIRSSRLTRWLLLMLTIGEIGLIGFVWKSTEPESLRAALSKEGTRYILRWENTDHSVEFKTFSSPIEALEFAQQELSLRPGVNPKFNDSLENLWVRNDMGRRMIFWKTWGFDMVHRLTFKDEAHAAVFENAFKKGAYSPSPIGHAIYLVKVASP
ncbi:hypothetical protein EBQ90_02505 [bacterium]|nr:hypothetical protein [bacterium]